MDAEVIFCLVLGTLSAAYSGMILAFSIGLFKRRSGGSPAANMDFPFVSVVIPARNEALNLPSCLLGIVLQRYPPDRFEILVSDDHSEDDTIQVVGRFLHEHPGHLIRLIMAEGDPATGKKAALDRAVRCTSGDIILATDADTLRESGWMAAMVREFTSGNREMVLGPVELARRSGFFPRLQALEFMGIMGITAGSAGLGSPVMCNGANLLYSKRAYLETGGITRHARFASGDDQFLMTAVKKKYGKKAISFALDPQAIVSTFPQPGPRAFLSQRLRWVSKSSGYRDPLVILSGLLVYLFHLMILAGMISGLFLPGLLYCALLGWGVKLMADLLPLVPMARFFRRKQILWLYLPGQAFQLLYVALSGILGLILPYRWKGRLIRT